MNKETKKVIFAVARVFVDAANKGNNTTLSVSEIHTAVCRTLHRRKEREKKNLEAPVGAAIDRLKRHRILFETIDEWGPTKIKIRRFKAADAKRKFGMTATALDYLTRGDRLAGYSIKSELIISDLLLHFGAIEHETAPIVITSPAALVETVAAIKEENNITPQPVSQSTIGQQISTNNVQRLIATIRNKSASWPNVHTPADLLGALAAHYINTESGETAVGSAKKIGWEEVQPRRYRLAREVLEQHGLVTHSEKRKIPGKTGVRGYGIQLTDLGLEVAVDGDFKDQSHKITTQKSGTMLKDHKKNQPETPALASPEQQQMREMMEEMHRLREEVQALRAQTSDTPTPVEEEAVKEEYTELATMSIVLQHAAPRLMDAIKPLLTDEDAKDSTPPATMQINTTGLYLALTEVDRMISGIKAYVSECIRDDEEVDMELLEAYAKAYSAAANVLETKKTLPILGEKVVTKRFLAGSSSISRSLWPRPAAARA